MLISQVNPAGQSTVVQGEAVFQRTPAPIATPKPEFDKVPLTSIPLPSVDPQVLREAVDKINQTVNVRASNLNFSVDEETGLRVVKVMDTSTKEVIRQFPSEEALSIARSLDQLKGLLVRDKA